MLKKYLFPGMAFVLPFVIYIFTMIQGIAFTDSGELAGACVSLGVAHPTGYPLFIIFGHLWSMLPLPFSMIIKMNMFAAFLTAVSSVILYFSVIELTEVSVKLSKSKKKESFENQPLIALITSLTYSFGLIVWGQATSIEVYALHLVFINLILLLSFKAVSNEFNIKYLLALSLVLGLSFTNHMTTVLLVPGLIFLFFKRPGERFDFSGARFKELLIMLIPFVIGLSIYIYLPLRSASGPEFNWGEVSRGIDKFLYHVQGKQYQVWMFSGSETIGTNFGKFFSALPGQFAYIGILISLIGMYGLYKVSRTLTIFLLIVFATGLFYSLNYSIHDIEAYFLTSFIIMAFFIPFGINLIVRKKPVIVYLFLLMPLFSIADNYNENDRSMDFLVDSYTEIMADNLEENAVIISAQWDFWCSAFWYKQRIEGFRKDIALIEKELLRRTWYRYQLERWYPEIMKTSKPEMDLFAEDLEKFESDEGYDPQSIQYRFVNLLNSFIDKNIDSRPVYLTLDIMQTDPEVGKDYIKVPIGFAFRLFRQNDTTGANIKEIDLDMFLKSLLARGIHDGKGGLTGEGNHLEIGIMDAASMNITNMARYAQTLGKTDSAIKYYNMALEINPENKIAYSGLMQISPQK